jgi:hypothetical protein
LKSIYIPCNVKILAKSCFSHSKLESITFESESKLVRIEDVFDRSIRVTDSLSEKAPGSEGPISDSPNELGGLSHFSNFNNGDFVPRSLNDEDADRL